MKQKICLFLSLIILSVSVFSSSVITVSAEPQIDNSVRSQVYWGLTQAAGTLGYILGPNAREAIYDFACNSLSWLPTYVDTGECDRVKYDPSTGLMVFTAQAIQELKDTIDDYFSQESNLPDMVWIPVIPADEFKTSHFYSIEQYYRFRSYSDNVALTYVCTDPSTEYFKVYDFSNYAIFLYSDGGSSWALSDFQSKLNSANLLATDLTASTNEYWDLYLATSGGVALDHRNINGVVYKKDGTKSESEAYIALSYGWNDSFSLYIYPDSAGAIPTRFWSGNKTDSQGFLVCSPDQDAHYVPIFRDIARMKLFFTGQSDYYRVTPTYTGGDITVNPNADYSTVYNNISQTIQNNYNDGKDYSDILAAIQVSYSESMKKLAEELGGIEDNTEESNTWLEQIKKNTDALIDPDGGSWLARIYEQEIAIQESIEKGFADLLDAFSVDTGTDDPGSGGSSGDDSGGDASGGAHKTFWTKLGDFASGVVTVVLDLISTIVFKALDGIAYLVGVLVDNVEGVFTGMGDVLSALSSDLVSGNGFFIALFEKVPMVVKNLIAYLIFCIVSAGIIKMLRG